MFICPGADPYSTRPLGPCHAPFLVWWLFSRVLDPGDLHYRWAGLEMAPRHVATCRQWSSPLFTLLARSACSDWTHRSRSSWASDLPVRCEIPDVWPSGQELSSGSHTCLRGWLRLFPSCRPVMLALHHQSLTHLSSFHIPSYRCQNIFIFCCFHLNALPSICPLMSKV